MTYDVDETPRSVELQERIEGQSDLIRYLISRLMVVGLFLLITYDIVTSSKPVEGATGFAQSVTLEQIAFTLAAILALGTVLSLITLVHEILHAAAIYSLGIEPWFTVDWPEIRGRKIYSFPAGGEAGAVSLREQLSLSWIENTYVSLAPILIPVILIAVGGLLQIHYHPFSFESQVGIYVSALLIVLFLGPSIPDWKRVFTSPKYRYETYVEVEEAIERHTIAEGARS